MSRAPHDAPRGDIARPVRSATLARSLCSATLAPPVRSAAFAALIAAVGAGLAVSAVRAAPSGSVPTNEDLRHVRTLANPRLSPDGTRVVIEIADATADGGRSHLWLIDVAANSARQITWSAAGDTRGEHGARWLGDGSILFLAKRGERTQLFRLPMAGGEAHAYDVSAVPPVDASTEPDALPPRKADEAAARRDPLPLEVEEFEPAPDGRSIAIIARDPETPGEKKQKDEKADAQWIDHDLHGKRAYLIDADSAKLTALGVAPDVTAAVWSLQSDRLLVLAELPNHAHDLGPAGSAWLVKVQDPGHPARVVELPPTLEAASWTEDGTALYFRAQASHDTPPGYSDLYVMNLADRSIRNLSAEFSGSIGGEPPIVAGRDVIQSVQQGFTRGYLRIRGASSHVIHFDTPVVSRLDCGAKRSRCVWLGQSATQPNTLYYADALDGAAHALDTPRLLPGDWRSTSPLPVSWSSDGLAIEGRLYLPAQAASGKVPLVVDVHGGPMGAWSDAFDPLTVFLLGQGWGVLRVNPRGSTGYGAAFVAANKDDLGGGDYRDLMAGVDTVLARYPIDADKLALIGYSYGGEMAGFVEGSTDRFRAIVSGAPVIDQESEYGTEDDSWYDRWYYGKPWEHAEDAWRQSPLSKVAHAKTPFMLIQGESDSIDPPGQSFEMYRALRQAGVPVELVQYPREDHGPLSLGLHGSASPEPWHGFDARRRLVRFIQAAFDHDHDPAPKSSDAH